MLRFNCRLNIGKGVSLKISIAVILFLAMLLTFLVYPFIATADGLTRVAIASGLPFSNFTVLPPLQSFLIKSSIRAVGGVGLYTLVQVVLFYISVLAVYKCLLRAAPSVFIFIALPTILIPIFFVFPAILTDSSLVFTCLALIGFMIIHIGESNANKYFCFFIFTGLLCVLFGIRLNSIVVAPVIVVLVFLYANSFKWYSVVSVCLSAVFVLIINSDFRSSARPEALGMAWEIISVVKDNKNDKFLGSALDFCGSTEQAVSRYNDRFLNSIFWDASPPLPVQCITSVAGSAQVKNFYFSMISKYPLEWIRVKASFWGRVYGLSAPLENIRRGVHGVDDRTKAWGGRESPHQLMIRESFFNSADFLGALVYRPVVSLVLSLLSVVMVFYFSKESFGRFFCIFSLSNFYYAGFMISAQSMEFRYFAPTFYLNFIIFVSLVLLLIVRFLRRGVLYV